MVSRRYFSMPRYVLVAAALLALGARGALPATALAPRGVPALPHKGSQAVVTDAGAHLVRDFNTTPAPAGSFCGSRTLLGTLPNGAQLLMLYTAATGCELWRSDGTEAGTVLLKDIFPGASSGIQGNITTTVNNRLLFVANDGALGAELWTSDGTAVGTYLVRDLCPGACQYSLSPFYAVAGRIVMQVRLENSDDQLWVTDGTAAGTQWLNVQYRSINRTAVVNSRLFFECSAVGTDDAELCVTDGTAAGTRLLMDIRPGALGSDLRSFTPFGNRLIFFADDGAHGVEPWTSDGTTTNMVADVRPGALDSFAGGAVQITKFDGTPSTVLFIANDGVHGAEIWRTDGTAAETALVKDWVVGAAGSDPQLLGAQSVTALYSVNTPAAGREPVAVSLGGAVSVSVGDIQPGAAGSDPFGFYTDASSLYFLANDGTHGRELWRTTIGAATATMVADLAAGDASLVLASTFNFQGQLFFAAAAQTDNYELYKTTGGSPGAALVKDIRPGSQSSGLRGFFMSGNTLLFTANDGVTGEELWRSDGSTAGTALFKNVNPDAGNGGLNVPFAALPDGNALLSACATNGLGSNDCTLWRSGGSFSNTAVVLPLQIGSFYKQSALNFGDTLIFSGGASNDQEPWRTDGTAAGTFRLRDINPTGGSLPYGFIRIGDWAYFSQLDGADAGRVWRTDGSVSNTQPLTTAVRLFGAVSGNAYFYQAGDQIWRSDLALTHTAQVKVVPNILSGDFMQFVPGAPGQVFVIVDRDYRNGNNRPVDLWVSDGTPEGTRFVKTIAAVQIFGRQIETVYANGLLYFVSDVDGSGYELWKSDGTSDGTVRVRDIFPGAGGSSPANLTPHGGALYFSATDADNRRLLFESDGTDAGTGPVRADANAPLVPTGLVATANGVFFTAADAAHGNELWRSDGTAAGTALAHDIEPGPSNANPRGLMVAGGNLFFVARTASEGEELWALSLKRSVFMPLVRRS